MKKQEKKQVELPKLVQGHLGSCRMAEDDLAKLDEALRAGADIEPIVRQLTEHLREIRHEADTLHATLCAGPMAKLLSVNRIKLSEQEYHLLQAAGANLFSAKGIGICPVSDYEVYRHCVYEDEKMVCFMDPNETSDVVTADEKTAVKHIRLRMAYAPEELKLKNLRPEQRAFFEKYRPDVIQRMARD